MITEGKNGGTGVVTKQNEAREMMLADEALLAHARTEIVTTIKLADSSSTFATQLDVNTLLAKWDIMAQLASHVSLPMGKRYKLQLDKLMEYKSDLNACMLIAKTFNIRI